MYAEVHSPIITLFRHISAYNKCCSSSTPSIHPGLIPVVFVCQRRNLNSSHRNNPDSLHPPSIESRATMNDIPRSLGQPPPFREYFAALSGRRAENRMFHWDSVSLLFVIKIKFITFDLVGSEVVLCQQGILIIQFWHRSSTPPGAAVVVV